MIYDSDIAKELHESKLDEFKFGLVSEAEMRKWDKLCLTAKAFKEKYAKGNNARKAVSVEHADFVNA